MKKVSIVGSGNVGVNSAFFIAETAAAHVTLVDIQEGISTGKALDLMEAGPIRNYRTSIQGSDDIEAIAGSEVVVLAAGSVRAPGQDRSELFKDNARIVKDLAARVLELAPKAVVVVATEPVDAMTQVFVRETGFGRNRVMGVGGVLDSTRMAHFVAEALNISPRDVTAMVIGSHSRHMIPVIEYTRVSGIPVDQLLSEEQLARIVDDTRHAGTLIVELAKRSSAYYAPSAAIAQVVEAVAIDMKKVLSVSVLLEGEFGIRDVALSVPCRIGAAGIEDILEIRLGEEVERALHDAAEAVRGWF